MNQLARDAKFVQRESKLNGSLFLDLIIFNSEYLKNQSLNGLSILLKERHGIEIKKQSLHERFNKYSVVFLKEALEKVLRKQIHIEISLLKQLKGFNRILIKDSTSFQLDESLAQYYPGSGGSGSKASMRIQFEYDTLSGKINDLSVNAFNEQDAKDSVATIELTQKGDLIIRDLAYMSLEVLNLIAERMAYFLCRVNPILHILEKVEDGYEKLDFIRVTKFMKEHNIGCMEKEVYLGNEEKFQVRLIIHLLPEQEVAKRLRKAKQRSKKKGGSGIVSKESKARSHLNLFVTNGREEQIPTENVWKFYRLRWQIELIFKIWKSICNIEKVKKVKQHRLECYIYSKLMIIVLGWQLMWKIAKQLLDKEGKALSFLKASKTLFRTKFHELREVFFLRKRTMKSFMKSFYDISRTNHLLEKRKEEPTSLELLINCLSD